MSLALLQGAGGGEEIVEGGVLLDDKGRRSGLSLQKEGRSLLQERQGQVIAGLFCRVTGKEEEFVRLGLGGRLLVERTKANLFGECGGEDLFFWSIRATGEEDLALEAGVEHRSLGSGGLLLLERFVEVLADTFVKGAQA